MPMKDTSRPVAPITGQTALTRMLSGPSSTASDLLIRFTAPFEMLYQVRPGRGRMPAVEPMFWITPLRFQGKPVWVGQISRDIGVRVTPRTWNLTTHTIDSNVDEARDYVLDDLMEAGRVSHVAYVAGAEAAERTAPRRNLTGDPYFTNGLRALAVFSESRRSAILLDWDQRATATT